MQTLTVTVKLRLYTDAVKERLFRQMTRQYRQACNFVSRYIFEHEFELNSYHLHKELYRQVRSDFALKSQLTGSVFRTVTAHYKAVKTQLLQNPFRYRDVDGKYHKIEKTLEWLYKPVYFSRPQADLVRDRDYSFVENGTMLSINTLAKRVRVRFACAYFSEYPNGSWRLGTAKLVNLNGIWYLHIPATRAFEEFEKATVKHVAGIDRGLRFLATTYDERGNTTFFSGKQILIPMSMRISLKRRSDRRNEYTVARNVMDKRRGTSAL